MKKREEQAGQLMEALRTSRSLELSGAMAMLGISQSTARRLFDLLESRGEALRVHGGLRLMPDRGTAYSFDRVEAQHAQEKTRIAHRAADYLVEGETVYLDSGTTVAQVCLALARRLQAGELKSLGLFTNSLANLDLLAPFCDVTLIGGAYRPHRRDFCGYLAEEAVRRLHFDKCILGTDGYQPQYGFTTTDFDTARLNEWVLRRAGEVMVVADASKFEAASVVSFAQAGDIHHLVTDAPLPLALAQQLEEAGVKVMLA